MRMAAATAPARQIAKDRACFHARSSKCYGSTAGRRATKTLAIVDPRTGLERRSEWRIILGARLKREEHRWLLRGPQRQSRSLKRRDCRGKEGQLERYLHGGLLLLQLRLTKQTTRSLPILQLERSRPCQSGSASSCSPSPKSPRSGDRPVLLAAPQPTPAAPVVASFDWLKDSSVELFCDGSKPVPRPSAHCCCLTHWLLLLTCEDRPSPCRDSHQ